nr:MAG TPA: hypothetical protein [Caudoviricetes sp.]
MDASDFRVFIVTYISSVPSYTKVLYWITKKPPRQKTLRAIPERKTKQKGCPGEYYTPFRLPTLVHHGA